MDCTFSISRWYAVSTRLVTPEQWQAWAEGALDADTLPESRPDVAFLPALQRRRLGLSARLLFQAAHPLLAEGEHCPLVLSSYDGEINRSFELWPALLRDSDVSPTSFGLSVHNALAGQWSMLRGDMSEYTTLSVQQDGLETAVIEALGFIADGAPKVLVVLTDEPIHADHGVQPVQFAPFPYAVALLVEAGAQWRIERVANDDARETTGYWGALNWVRQQHLGTTDWVNQYRDKAWRWIKAA